MKKQFHIFRMRLCRHRPIAFVIPLLLCCSCFLRQGAAECVFGRDMLSISFSSHPINESIPNNVLLPFGAIPSSPANRPVMGRRSVEYTCVVHPCHHHEFRTARYFVGIALMCAMDRRFVQRYCRRVWQQHSQAEGVPCCGGSAAFECVHVS